ncbi:hypothetical protein PG991_006028 [Apiospora marii]|uniref:Uncharacterized protein n=1 Tax=Apiospora marii TaxID=335849 RepID=A0ABR1SAV7_9PEZI
MANLQEIQAHSRTILEKMQRGSRIRDCLDVIWNPPRGYFLFEDETDLVKKEVDRATMRGFLQLDKNYYENTRRRILHLLACWENMMVDKENFGLGQRQEYFEPKEFVALYQIIARCMLIGCPVVPDRAQGAIDIHVNGKEKVER